MILEMSIYYYYVLYIDIAISAIIVMIMSRVLLL